MNASLSWLAGAVDNGRNVSILDVQEQRLEEIKFLELTSGMDDAWMRDALERGRKISVNELITYTKTRSKNFGDNEGIVRLFACLDEGSSEHFSAYLHFLSTCQEAYPASLLLVWKVLHFLSSSKNVTLNPPQPYKSLLSNAPIAAPRLRLKHNELIIRLPKSRKDVPIKDNNEPLVPISSSIFYLPPLEDHPYIKLGAPYDEASPYMVRKACYNMLLRAARTLEKTRPGYKIEIFDAYRPASVQKFMVRLVTRQNIAKLLEAENDEIRRMNELLGAEKPRLDPNNAMHTTIERYRKAYRQTLNLWARPRLSPDSTAPSPHSTGGAVDVRIRDAEGNILDMGSEIDVETGAHPEHFASSQDPKEQIYHANRELLREIMEDVGFIQLESEYWHFSFGDQYAELVKAERTLKGLGKVRRLRARYGVVNLKKSAMQELL